MIVQNVTEYEEKYSLNFVQTSVHENSLHLLKLLEFSSRWDLYITVDLLELIRFVILRLPTLNPLDDKFSIRTLFC